MSVETKLDLSSGKFKQLSGDTLNLSGTTNLYKSFVFKSGSTLTFLPNKGAGKVMTSDADGNITLQPSSTVTGTPKNIVIIASGGTGMVDSGIPFALVLAGL